MASITTSVEIAATPAAVWAVLEDIADHVTWMADAERLTFVGDITRGVGTEIEVATRVGPLRTTDRMRFVTWEDGVAMGVRHEGLVSGQGAFTLVPVGDRATRVEWAEELEFPIHFGGRLGAAVASPLLRRIWKGNLDRLKARVEGG